MWAQNETGVERAIGPQRHPFNEVIDGEDSIEDNDVLKGSNCSANITVTSKGGTIKSPNYPSSYSSDLHCQWFLEAPQGNLIVLKLLYFNLELSPECKYDNFRVYAGKNKNAQLIGKYCGELRDSILSTNSSQLVITFTSDSTFEERGFEIRYELDTISTVKNCQAEMNKTEGTITSPQFPNNYPENTDCWTLIRVPLGKYIYLNFDMLSLEHDEKCSYDYVEVLDGSRQDSPSLGKFCSEVQMVNIISTNNTMLLHFHSDGVVNDKGFRARYSTDGFVREGGKVGDCSWTFTETNGTILSPHYPNKYPSNSKCIIHVKAPEDYHIKLEIQHLILEADANCSYDWLEFRDGYQEGSPVLGRYCGSLKEKKRLQSKTNKMSVVFNSDGFADFTGFQLFYWFEEDEFVTFNASAQQPISPLVLNSAEAFLHVSKNATVTQGTSHELFCVPKNPTARVRWLLQDNFIGGDSIPTDLIMTGNTTIKIEKMDRQHVGVYTCAAVTPKEVAYAKIWISISYDNPACGIVLRKSPKDVTTNEGELAILECSTLSPGVSISWEKNGEAVEQREDVQILHNGYLLFKNIEAKDQGIYTCIANNTRDQCYKSSSAKVTIVKRINVTEICGRPKFGHSVREKAQEEHGKIVGGKETEEGAYPWQVMLWEPERKAFCGGSIINERWIMTAAHCFAIRANLNWRSVIIKLGKYDQTKVAEEHEFASKIDTLIYHPSFEPSTLDNDVALIRTVRHITFTDYILPICLGEQKAIEENFFSRAYKMGTVTGWGQLVDGGSVSRFLREVRLPIIPQGTCRQSLLGTKFVATRNTFCAGNAQEAVADACRGDSGGPFVAEHKKIWYLIGLVSWGDGCAKKDRYGFYTKVNNYHSWIKGIIQT